MLSRTLKGRALKTDYLPHICNIARSEIEGPPLFDSDNKEDSQCAGEVSNFLGLEPSTSAPYVCMV